MIPLRQSTASQEISLGQFLDSTDGDTEEGSLTIANTDIKLWMHGATTLANKNSGGATYISNGVYYCVLDATDTATLGGLTVFVHVSGALAVKTECFVYPTNVFDSLYSTDKLEVDIIQCGGSTVAAGAIPNAAADAAGGLPVSDVGGLDLDTKLANTDEVTVSRMGALTDWINGGRLDLILDLCAVEANVQGHVNTSLSAYNGPTDAEMIAAFTEIKGATWASGTDTLEHIRNKQTDIETDTGQIGTAGAGLTDLGGMSSGMQTEVNNQVADVVRTDTTSEMSQGAPPSTPTMEEMIAYIYFSLRNKNVETSTEHQVFDDAGTTILYKADMSDVAGVLTKAEYVSGA